MSEREIELLESINSNLSYLGQETPDYADEFKELIKLQKKTIEALAQIEKQIRALGR